MDFSAVTQDPETFDASAAKLTSGLEIHQQLATRKLFCCCPSTLLDGKPDFTVVRQLRASAGESGEIDKAALHETLKKKSFHYQGYHANTCLVELDEEPPSPISQEAVEVALQMAKLVHATVLPKVQVMRKTVVDGSNTGGFQRTALLTMGGSIEDSAFGKVGIQMMALEEDAAQIVERTPTHDVYNLSRLGIPLIEIATDPDLKTPDAIQAASAYIGMLFRSTRKVRRGIGTIRQDVNISVLGGNRVEVKGAQDLRTLPELVRFEASRHLALERLKEALKPQKFSSTQTQNVTVLCKNATGFLKKALDKGDQVIGVGLPGLKGLLGTELVPKYRVGTELAGYGKAHGFGGIIHADEDEKKYGLAFSSIRKELSLNEEDSFLLLVGDEALCVRVIERILIPRIKQLWKGVPSEVRKPNADSTTTYLRPMPGAARMYPETDIPDVEIDASTVVAPKLLKEQEAGLVKQFGVTQTHAKEMIRDGWDVATYGLADFVHDYNNLGVQFIAATLMDVPKEIKKRFGKEIHLDEHMDELKAIFGKANDGKIPKEAVIELLAQVADGKKLDFAQYKMLDDSEVEKIIDGIIAANSGKPINALMGMVMAKLRGKADGKKIMDLLRKKAS